MTKLVYFDLKGNKLLEEDVVDPFICNYNRKEV